MSKQKLLRLAAGSLIAACSAFGPTGLATADEGGGDGSEPGVPQPVPPNIPDDPSEGLPIPLPGGGA